MMDDLFQVSLTMLVRRRARAWLATLGVILGITLFVVVTLLAESVSFQERGSVESVLAIMIIISLFTGSAIIALAMHTTILYRHNEFGIMRALGADKKAIVVLVLFESAALGFIGGVIGIITTLAMMILFFFSTQLPFSIDSITLLSAIPVAIGVGCTTGFLSIQRVMDRAPARTMHH